MEKSVGMREVGKLQISLMKIHKSIISTTNRSQCYKQISGYCTYSTVIG